MNKVKGFLVGVVRRLGVIFLAVSIFAGGMVFESIRPIEPSYAEAESIDFSGTTVTLEDEQYSLIPENGEYELTINAGGGGWGYTVLQPHDKNGRKTGSSTETPKVAPAALKVVLKGNFKKGDKVSVNSVAGEAQESDSSDTGSTYKFYYSGMGGYGVDISLNEEFLCSVQGGTSGGASWVGTKTGGVTATGNCIKEDGEKIYLADNADIEFIVATNESPCVATNYAGVKGNVVIKKLNSSGGGSSSIDLSEIISRLDNISLKLDGLENTVPTITVCEGQDFNVALGYYDDMLSGSSSDGLITVTNTTVGDKVIIVSGKLTTKGVYAVDVNGKTFLVKVIEEPTTSNVKVILN